MNADKGGDGVSPPCLFVGVEVGDPYVACWIKPIMLCGEMLAIWK